MPVFDSPCDLAGCRSTKGSGGLRVTVLVVLQFLSVVQVGVEFLSAVL